MKTVRWSVGILAAALLAVAVSSCSLFQATLTVVNSSSYTVVELYISESDETTWGDNWLTASIPIGSSRIIDGICAGTYDLMAVEPGGGGWLVLSRQMNANQGYTWTLTDATYIGP